MHSSPHSKSLLRAAQWATLLLTVLLLMFAGESASAQSKKRAQSKKGTGAKKEAAPKKQLRVKKQPRTRAKPKKQARPTKQSRGKKSAKPKQRTQPAAKPAPKPKPTPPTVYEQPAWQPAYVPQPATRPDVPVNIITLPQLVNPNNYSVRKPNFVIIHHTGQNTCDETLLAFSLPQAEVSAHYLVCRDGTVYHVLSDSLRAHHAGIGRWGAITDMNSCSIGIELDNNGQEPFYEAQITSLLGLLDRLKTRYAIPTANFIGHADYAPGRKSDPSVRFPWAALAAQGFGRWHSSTARDTVPAGFDHLMAMRCIGYDTRDSTAAIRAFKRHFMQDDSTQRINDADRDALYQLAGQ